MPYTIKPGSFKYKKSNGQFSEIDCFEGPDLTEEVAALEKVKAPIIIDSATGNPIAIKDGADGLPVEGMKIHFSPKQDLHGYDNPWPAGGGKNLINFDQVVTEIINTPSVYLASGTYYLYVANEKTLAFNSFVYISTDGASFEGITTNTENQNAYANQTMGYNVKKCIVTVVSPVHLYVRIQSNANLSGATVKVLLTKDATNYNDISNGLYSDNAYFKQIWTPYSNICPIIGWTGLTAWRTGKNLLPLPVAETKSGITLTHNADGSITLDGTSNSLVYFDFFSGDFDSHNLAGYRFVAVGYSSITNVSFRISESDRVALQSSTNGSMIINDNGNGLYFAIRIASGTAMPTGGLTIYPMLIESETDETFEPYTGASYPVTFPGGQTVYGGTLDAVSRVLTVDTVLFAFKDLVALNGSSANWVYNSTYNLFETQNAIIPTGTANTETGIVCSCYQSRPYGYNSSYSSENSIVWAHTSGTLRIKDNRYTDVDVWKTAIADEQIVIPIATTIEIPIDPITVQTLLGNNTIWSDANGQIELDYRADTKMFCQKNDQVNDVQINGTSILDANGSANIPIAGISVLGAVKVNSDKGVLKDSGGTLCINKASANQLKAGTDIYFPIVPSNQHQSVFYGLAKASGDISQASSANAVGVYTDDAKSKISDMLNAPVSVSGTTPTITGKAGLRYICGEVATLTITAPASGCIDIVFESGSTATVLTLTSAKTGVNAIKWANGFDPTALEANTTYEINILDGEFGVVGSWT